MNNFEFASFLSIKGYKVYDRGLDIESFMLEDYQASPINYSKLEQAAAKEGYSLSDGIWSKSKKAVSY